MAGIAPEGHLTIREALRILVEIRCEGLEMSAAVAKVRALGVNARHDRSDFDAAALFFWSQVDAEKLVVRAEDPRSGAFVVIRPSLLDVPLLRRYSVSDLTYLRSTHPLSKVLFQRFGPSFKSVQLLISEVELQQVLKGVRRARKRKEAHPGTGNPVGRPSKLATAKPAISKIIDAKQWKGAQSLKKLAQILSRAPYNLEVSSDTAARALDELFEETSDRRFQRMRKGSRTPTLR